MAITINNTIARVSAASSAQTVTTGTFNVAAGEGLIATINMDQSDPGAVDSVVLSDNQTPDLTWLVGPARGASEAGAGWAGVRYVHSAAAITGLTVTITGNGDNHTPSIKILKCTGHDTADMLGAVTEGNLTTDPQTTTAITSETAGTFFAIWTDWTQSGAPTSSDLTITTVNISGNYSGASGYKTIASAGASVTGNMNSGGTPTGNWVAFEIRAAAVAGLAGDEGALWNVPVETY